MLQKAYAAHRGDGTAANEHGIDELSLLSGRSPVFHPSPSSSSSSPITPSTSQRYGPVQISLLDVMDRPWSEIGHEGLDKAEAPTLTRAQIAMLGFLNISLTFVGKPAVIDVDRGFWDVPHVRRKLPDVADSLPPALRRKFCKTVKMMFAWNIEITIKLASGAQVSSGSFSPAPSLGDLNLSFLRLGLAPDASKADELKFVSGSPPYPLLLAVLSQVV